MSGNGASPAVAVNTIVESALNVATITAIDLNGEDITVDGQTVARADIVAYAYKLRDSGQYAEVRIALMEQIEGGYNFSIVITR